ncbi:hypothetical protein RB628_04880 [Streptomyces sp. ADMS]|uniref:hypothetical protein n=1 Tax=Streptomyces sp. ADMS TaxID=3071415 RepID=UPI00296EBF83|nr:hypothetical protein [Streptomyces sp. ADMS]MDW4904695.1 hypothetical protein [Streptomyces sp. ADMS]
MTETEQRLAAAEEELRTLRAELSALKVAAAETRVMVTLTAMQTPEARSILSALTAEPSDYGVPQKPRPAARAHLRLVHATDGVSGQDMDEALRRVRRSGGQ